MRQDLPKAKAILKQITDADSSDLRAWSLLAAVTMQQSDAAKTPAEKAVFDKELEDVILPEMEKQARGPNDYYVQTTRAFLLMRKGAEKRREARDAFAAAARERPDVAATQDLVMGLDISLDDAESAERHAREVLRRNRNSPLANYVMGSLSLKRGDYDAAERYLRKASDAKSPVVLAMNDLAEVLRRTKRYDEAERYAKLAVKTNPNLYVAWETVGSVLMDSNGDLDEAQRCIEKAVELSKVDGRSEDVRMLVSLARVLWLKGDKKMARVTLRKVQSRVGELSEFEKQEYDELMKNVR
jgi:tetratricopeptide (TPR) repeat protein